jgi:hypothetical protein
MWAGDVPLDVIDGRIKAFTHQRPMSAFGSEADIGRRGGNFR